MSAEKDDACHTSKVFAAYHAFFVALLVFHCNKLLFITPPKRLSKMSPSQHSPRWVWSYCLGRLNKERRHRTGAKYDHVTLLFVEPALCDNGYLVCIRHYWFSSHGRSI